MWLYRLLSLVTCHLFIKSKSPRPKPNPRHLHQNLWEVEPRPQYLCLPIWFSWTGNEWLALLWASVPLPIKFQDWEVASLSLDNHWSRPGLLKLRCAPKPTGILLKGRFWVSRPRVEPELLHFLQASEAHWYFRIANCTWGNKGLGAEERVLAEGQLTWLPGCVCLHLAAILPELRPQFFGPKVCPAFPTS